jgi:hypothetical protein
MDWKPNHANSEMSAPIMKQLEHDYIQRVAKIQMPPRKKPDRSTNYLEVKFVCSFC